MAVDEVVLVIVGGRLLLVVVGSSLVLELGVGQALLMDVLLLVGLLVIVCVDGCCGDDGVGDIDNGVLQRVLFRFLGKNCW